MRSYQPNERFRETAVGYSNQMGVAGAEIIVSVKGVSEDRIRLFGLRVRHSGLIVRRACRQFAAASTSPQTRISTRS